MAAEDNLELLDMEIGIYEAWRIKLYLRDMLKNHIWVTKDLREIHITDMTTEHIKNSIQLILKRGPSSIRGFGYNYLPILKKELSNRGEAYDSERR